MPIPRICPRAHEISGDNAEPIPGRPGKFRCRICHRIARRKSDWRSRGKEYAPPPEFTPQVSLALYEDYEFLKKQGMTIPQAAQKLGVGRSSIDRAIARYR